MRWRDRWRGIGIGLGSAHIPVGPLGGRVRYMSSYYSTATVYDLSAGKFTIHYCKPSVKHYITFIILTSTHTDSSKLIILTTLNQIQPFRLWSLLSVWLSYCEDIIFSWCICFRKHKWVSILYLSVTLKWHRFLISFLTGGKDMMSYTAKQEGSQDSGQAWCTPFSWNIQVSAPGLSILFQKELMYTAWGSSIVLQSNVLYDCRFYTDS